MAHYSVRAPNSTVSQQRVDDAWSGPQHRSYGAGPGPGPGAGAGSARLMETLEALRAEFEGIVHDNSVLKNQREDFEAKGAFCLYLSQHIVYSCARLLSSSLKF